MKRTVITVVLAVLTTAVTQAQEKTFRNPLKQDGADPWLTYHDGWYYLATTSGIDVRLRRAKHLAELKTAADHVVWRDDNPTRNRDIWAPEFHRLEVDGELRWYLYYTASDGREPGHRMYVAESKALMGPYSFKAQLRTDRDNQFYAIDGSVLTVGNNRYFVWCGRPSPAGQGLYISRMENPWTLAGERVYLPADGFGCRDVREGPVALPHGDRTFLVYSACPADTPDYKLGMLSIGAKDDPMDPNSWHQHPEPVFTRNDEAHVYGPGHNSFFKSPDGSEDWIAYHAKSGTERTYADRSTRVQRISWNTDGTPDFGKPVGVDVDLRPPAGESKGSGG